MNVLIIYAHPSKKSYTFQILEQLQDLILQKPSSSIEVSDLYAMNFKSEMSENEYEREGFAKLNLPIPDDVLLEHRKIEKADVIIFLYPVWWSDCPSIMKGWFDRVYAVGYAYGNYETDQKMPLKKFGLVVCPAGHPNEFLQETGIEQSMKKIMLDDRLGKRFQASEMIVLGGTLEIENVRKSHSQKLKTVIDLIYNYVA